MLGSWFGGRTAGGDPETADLPPETCDGGACDEGTGAATAVAEPAALPAAEAPAPAGDDGAAEVLRVRLAEVEGKLRTALERVGRRTTEVRNLEARLKILEPLVEQVRQRDQWLDEARKEVRRASGDREADSERCRALEADLAALRKEVDWRDFVIRDLETLPDQIRDRDAALLRLRREHVAALAGRDVEIERLRARLEDLQRAVPQDA